LGFIFKRNALLESAGRFSLPQAGQMFDRLDEEIYVSVI